MATTYHDEAIIISHPLSFRPLSYVHTLRSSFTPALTTIHPVLSINSFRPASICCRMATPEKKANMKDNGAASPGHSGMAPSSLFSKAYPSSSSGGLLDRRALQLHATTTMFQRAKSGGGHDLDPATAALMSRPAPALPPPRPPGPKVVHLGLTLRGLKKLAHRIEQMCEEGPNRRFKAGFEGLTTTELVYRCGID